MLPKTLIDATQPRWSAPKPISRFCEDSAFYYDFFFVGFLDSNLFRSKMAKVTGETARECVKVGDRGL